MQYLFLLMGCDQRKVRKHWSEPYSPVRLMFLKYRSGPIALLLKCLWWLTAADHRKCPASPWVPQPSWRGLIPFLAYLPLLVFTGSSPEWAVVCSQNTLRVCRLGLCFHCSFACLGFSDISTCWFHFRDSTFQHGRVERVRPWSHTKKSPESDSRLWHSLYEQVV